MRSHRPAINKLINNCVLRIGLGQSLRQEVFIDLVQTIKSHILEDDSLPAELKSLVNDILDSTGIQDLSIKCLTSYQEEKNSRLNLNFFQARKIHLMLILTFGVLMGMASLLVSSVLTMIMMTALKWEFDQRNMKIQKEEGIVFQGKISLIISEHLKKIYQENTHVA